MKHFKTQIGLLFKTAIVFLLIIVPKAQADEAEDWFYRGNQFQEQNRLPEAIDAYKRSIEINPKFWVTHQNLGLVYKKAKEYEKAEAAFKTALELAPENLDIQLNLGNVYNYLEQWDKAIAFLNRVVHRRENDPVAHGSLGWALLNYDKKPPFKLLVILNLRQAIMLFEQQRQFEAAEATRKTLNNALKKFGMDSKEESSPL